MSDDSDKPKTFSELIMGAFVGALISSSVVTFIGEYLAARRTESVLQEVRAEFEHRKQIIEWKKQSLESFIGPALMHLDRTKRAFQRYQAKSTFLESEIMFKSNLAVRDLILANGSLIPDDVRDVSFRLVEHYDRWLEKYDAERGKHKGNSEAEFVFVGPDGFPFPSEADALFSSAYQRLRSELYSPGIK